MKKIKQVTILPDHSGCDNTVDCVNEADGTCGGHPATFPVVFTDGLHRNVCYECLDRELQAEACRQTGIVFAD